tara:strand:+ start:38490 stop:38597 length:108 start_codon:yes stop_codon:yes gene_type:complete
MFDQKLTSILGGVVVQDMRLIGEFYHSWRRDGPIV